MLLRWQRLAFLVSLLFLFFSGLACARSALSDEPSWLVPSSRTEAPKATVFSFLPPTRPPGAPILTPTPDIPHPLPQLRTKEEKYVVQAGDTLGTIAQAYGVSMEQIMQTNQLSDPNRLDVGQELRIPVPTPEGFGSAFKIIPDSELVYSPSNVGFDLATFIKGQKGFINRYNEKINDESQNAAQLFQLIAQDYSVNPRLLLALLEYQSHWLTSTSLKTAQQNYPFGLINNDRKGLYHQLAWAANQLNRGYYLWRVNGVASWTMADGRVVPIDPTINAGTAALQYYFAQLFSFTEWQKAVSADGFFATYSHLFGYPFDYAIEPLLPTDLTQPTFQLPFERGVQWAFTGGPHPGWDSGSAWAALDFAPDNDLFGCVTSDEWVVALANGPIIRTGDGIVIQDVDDPSSPADGLEQTGWVILYMHIESRERVKSGTYLKAGDRIGHPSCEGGFSSGTHVHIARRYHGEWIPADQNLPFVMDGWVSAGSGVEYEGTLERNGVIIEAESGPSDKNKISR